MASHKKLSDFCWFRVGGSCQYILQPHNVIELQNMLSSLPDNIPTYVIGAGSNILISDDFHDAAFIILQGDFKNISYDKHHMIAGAAVLDSIIAKNTAQYGLSGLEFLIGIPGTIGGNVVMNAGAHHQQISDCLAGIDVIDRLGNITHLKAEQLDFSYRYCLFPNNHICIKAYFTLIQDNPSDVQNRLKELITKRHKTQPAGRGSGGSTFKNPIGYEAWKLIDDVDGRGLRIGGAHFSQKHCNFIINDDNASAHDIFLLGETIRERVFNETGILLEWEIRLIGFQAKTYE